MQPEVVAKTLSHVESEWKVHAQKYIECQSAEPTSNSTVKGCDESPVAFSKSCSTVVGAIVQGSSGDPTVMKEYMANVCGQQVMESWHQTTCSSLAKAITKKMTSSNYDNRISFQSGNVCTDFWSSFLVEEKSSYDKEQAALKEAENKAAEDAAKEAKDMEEKSAAEKRDMDAELAKDDSVKEKAEIDEEKKEIAMRANEAAERNMKQKAMESQVDEVEKAAESAVDDASKLEEESAQLDEESKALQSSSNDTQPVQPSSNETQPVQLLEHNTTAA